MVASSSCLSRHGETTTGATTPVPRGPERPLTAAGGGA